MALEFNKPEKERPKEERIKFNHIPVKEVRKINKIAEEKETSKSLSRATPMKNLQSYINFDDMKTLLQIAYDDNERNYLIMLTMFLTGRRISEVLYLKQKDLDARAGMIVWNILKKRAKDYKVIKPVPEILMRSLVCFCQHNNIRGEDYVFYSIKGRSKHLTRQSAFYFVKRYGKEMGLNLHPHQFRHSFAVELVRSMKHPGGLILLKNALEHSDLKITETYLQFSQKETADLQENLSQKLMAK